MTRFDFITHVEFRQALESDYREMKRCFETSSWKSVQVLAGSIVEALLIDYLVATKAKRAGKDPLRMDLAEAVGICKQERVLSERTADLSSVIRSYRNLIHPGRVVRLNEAPPSEASAQIAISLVEMIIDEVAQIRRDTFGLTAEQIVSKIERDPHSMSILKHLLADTNEQQLRRLLLEVLPLRYFDLLANDGGDYEEFEVRDRLEDSFRIALRTAGEQIQEAVASEFVRVLREEDGQRVTEYSEAFFRGDDISEVPEAQQAMVKEHLLARMSPTFQYRTLMMIKGIEDHLTPAEVRHWIDPIVRVLASDATSSEMKTATRLYYDWAVFAIETDVNVAMQKRLDVWLKHYNLRGAEATVDMIRQMLAELPSHDSE